jgi:hypothetical protein
MPDYGDSVTFKDIGVGNFTLAKQAFGSYKHTPFYENHISLFYGDFYIPALDLL